MWPILPHLQHLFPMGLIVLLLLCSSSSNSGSIFGALLLLDFTSTTGLGIPPSYFASSFLQSTSIQWPCLIDIPPYGIHAPSKQFVFALEAPHAALIRVHLRTDWRSPSRSSTTCWSSTHGLTPSALESSFFFPDSSPT